MGALLLQKTNVSSCGSGTLQSQEQQDSRKGHLDSSTRRIKKGKEQAAPTYKLRSDINIIFPMPIKFTKFPNV